MDRLTRVADPVKPTETLRRDTARSQKWRRNIDADIDVNVANLPRTMTLDLVCDYKRNNTRRRAFGERPAFKIRIGHGQASNVIKPNKNVSMYSKNDALIRFGERSYSLNRKTDQSVNTIPLKPLSHHRNQSVDLKAIQRSKIPKYKQLHKLGLEYPVIHEKSTLHIDETYIHKNTLPKLINSQKCGNMYAAVPQLSKKSDVSTSSTNANSANTNEVKILSTKILEVPYGTQKERHGLLNPLAKFIHPSQNQRLVRLETTDSLITHSGYESSEESGENIPERKSKISTVKSVRNRNSTIPKAKSKTSLNNVDLLDDLPRDLSEKSKAQRLIRLEYPIFNYKMDQKCKLMKESLTKRVDKTGGRPICNQFKRSLTDIKRYTPNLPKEHQEYRKLYGYSMKHLTPRDVLIAPDKTGDLYMEISFCESTKTGIPILANTGMSRYSPLPNPPPSAAAIRTRETSNVVSEISNSTGKKYGTPNEFDLETKSATLCEDNSCELGSSLRQDTDGTVTLGDTDFADKQCHDMENDVNMETGGNDGSEIEETLEETCINYVNSSEIFGINNNDGNITMDLMGMEFHKLSLFTPIPSPELADVPRVAGVKDSEVRNNLDLLTVSLNEVDLTPRTPTQSPEHPLVDDTVQSEESCECDANETDILNLKLRCLCRDAECDGLPEVVEEMAGLINQELHEETAEKEMTAISDEYSADTSDAMTADTMTTDAMISDAMTADEKANMVKDVQNMADFKHVQIRRKTLRRRDRMLSGGFSSTLLNIPNINTLEKRPPWENDVFDKTKNYLQKRVSAPVLSQQFLKIPCKKDLHKRQRINTENEKNPQGLPNPKRDNLANAATNTNVSVDQPNNEGKKQENINQIGEPKSSTIDTKSVTLSKTEITFVSPAIRF